MRQLRTLPGLLGACLTACLLTACATNPYGAEGRQISQQLLRQQTLGAETTIGTHPVSLVYSAYALHSASTAFQGDIVAMSGVVAQMSRSNVQLMFSNAQGAKATLPYATELDLTAGIANTAALADTAEKRAGKPPLLVVLLTSHGNTGNLTVNAAGANIELSAAKLAEALKALPRFPTLLVISACHSGSLIPALQAPNRIIMTASSADRVSFGCKSNSERTWFVDSLVNAFQPERTLREWFAATNQAVTAREKQFGYKASQPQLWVGRDMQQLATVPLAQIADHGPISHPPGATMQAPTAGISGTTP